MDELTRPEVREKLKAALREYIAELNVPKSVEEEPGKPQYIPFKCSKNDVLLSTTGFNGLNWNLLHHGKFTVCILSVHMRNKQNELRTYYSVGLAIKMETDPDNETIANQVAWGNAVTSMLAKPRFRRSGK